MRIFLAKNRKKIDINSLKSQFEGLRDVDPWFWPKAPKFMLFTLVAVVGYGLAWFFWLSSNFESINQIAAQEMALKESFSNKLAKANNLTALNEKKQQVTLFVNQLERQLPSRADIDALISDINQAGVEQGLRFLSLKPAGVAVKEYYAELPIAIQVVGRFHDLASFTAEISALSRIVTLHNLQISTIRDGRDLLKMDAIAKTYRYLDEEELNLQRKAKRDAAAKAGQK